MEWVRIALAALVVTTVSVGAFFFFTRKHKLRKNMDEADIEIEKRRAESITSNIGTAVVYLIQFGACIGASMPVFALGVLIVEDSISVPAIGDVLNYAAIFIVSWLAFAWCIRVTDALQE